MFFGKMESKPPPCRAVVSSLFHRAPALIIASADGATGHLVCLVGGAAPHENTVTVVGKDFATLELPSPSPQRQDWVDGAFVAGTQLIVIVSAERLFIYDVAKGELLHELKPSTSQTISMQFSALCIPTGSPFALLGRTNGTIAVLNVFKRRWSQFSVSIGDLLADARTGTSATATPHVRQIVSYPADPNSVLTLAGSWPPVKWYIVERRVSAVFVTADASQRVTCCAVSQAGGFIVGVTESNYIFVWSESQDKRGAK